ncbi:MAG: sulfate transporter [Idiomarina sp.]|uniref:STAS domain-containing protein n=1 Tax=Idiomarina sp. TaxID=1874361 RepID=UPI000C11D5E6|nr:STAS domain-containing protein [Idiomarina sp.]MBL4742450.1 STAS domain-containing protein [Idiomarina sp.]MBT42087.1 sulfate transporter [Idiomarina sp.]PHQ76919.1 MAG: sulfate transporter [Idiomarina sp.]
MSDITFAIEQQVLTISGSLTRQTIPSIWTTWRQAISADKVTKIDLSDVSNVDTAGVALLLDLVKEQGLSDISCVGANQQLQQIAAVSGVEGVLSLS